MTIGTRIYTWLNGIEIGADRFGNRYFTEKRPPADRRARRWVLYAGKAEASMVPPEWHAWLHHTVKEPPTVAPPPAQRWQKEHVPNLSGTEAAYHPPGSLIEGGHRPRANGDYEPWRPG